MDDSSLRARFRREGYAVLPDVLDAATVAACLAHLGRLRAELPLAPGAPVVAMAGGELFATELVADGRLVAVASVLLEAPVVCFGATYLCKPPCTGLPASWHQDGAPWSEQLAGAAALTAWIALDDADSGNGCLRAIPGSDRLRAEPLRPDGGEPSLFGVGMDPALVDVDRAVEIPVAAGGLVAHHPNLIHGSGPNCSDRPQTTLAVRYRSA